MEFKIGIIKRAGFSNQFVRLIWLDVKPKRKGKEKQT